jgi:hypothetical protein
MELTDYVSNAPSVDDPSKVGEYDLLCKAGGGYVWDSVLEYRVWSNAVSDEDQVKSFADYEEAFAWSEAHEDREGVLALIRQAEFFMGATRHNSILIEEERIAEWWPGWLRHENHRPSMLAAALLQNQDCS